MITNSTNLRIKVTIRITWHTGVLLLHIQMSKLIGFPLNYQQNHVVSVPYLQLKNAVK